MTNKKKPETTDARPPWFRIAEILHTRRVERYAAPNSGPAVVYYECNLCLGRSADLLGEIQHKDGCPVMRLR